MAINKKLIHFKTKQKFNEELANGNILETSIVFIQDSKEIYTHGQLYDGSKVDLSNIEASIQNIVDNYATKTEIPSLDEYITETELNNKGYLTKHQDISHLAEKSEIPSLDGYATEQWVEDKNYLTEHQNISHLASKEELNSELQNKQDKLISGTNIKTINGESILGSGDIVISGGNEETTIADGVYAVDANGKLIDYNLADTSALGVALVAGEHKFMIAKKDASNDGSSYNLYYDYDKGDLSLTNYSTADGTKSSGYLGGSSTPQLSQDFTTWTEGALSDFNGKSNTQVIAASSSNAKDMCKVLETFNAGSDNQGHSDWYVPACGQLALMYLAKTDINAALAKIGGTAFESSYYWSSSELVAGRAWTVAFSVGLVSGGLKDNNGRVRFVRDISVKPLKERVSDLETSKQDKLISGTNIKTINGESILGEGNLTVNTEANIQAVDTGDVVEDVNVSYATTEYVDSVLGDINSILESIINS